jgi:ABC-type amino acid transport system permease subunit
VFIALIKNSGIAAVFSVLELTAVADTLGTSVSAQPVAAFAAAAVIYVAFGLLSGLAINVLERRVAVKR